MRSEICAPSIRTCVPMVNVFLTPMDLIVNVMKAMKRTEMANVWTSMSVKMDYAAMGFVGTRKVDLTVNVPLASICQLMVLSAQISMSVNRLGCVLMGSVQTWMDPSSVSVMMASNFPSVVSVALMLMSVKKTH